MQQVPPPPPIKTMKNTVAIISTFIMQRQRFVAEVVVRVRSPRLLHSHPPPSAIEVSLGQCVQARLHPGRHDPAVGGREDEATIGIGDQLVVESCRIPLNPVSDVRAGADLCLHGSAGPGRVEDTLPEGGDLQSGEVLLRVGRLLEQG